ncbi:MAG: carbohydrate ABC transporter permease [Acetatifactor sp.]|nr:carbohydrate ABC transporter permease [Acetatifactor sp.]
MQNHRKKYAGTYAILTACMLVVLFALYIAVITSFMTKEEANYVEFHWIPKQGLSLRAYIDAFTKDYGGTNVFIGLKNTLLMYVPSILVGLYVSAVSAFAFAKMRFPGRKLMYTLLIAGMLIPVSTGTIAKLLIYDRLGWIGTPWPIMVPRMMGMAGMIFFLRQYYVSLPSELLDAARIDGLSYFGTFNRVILPISVSPLLVQFIFAFIAAYNDYNDPLYFLTSNAKLRTIQLTLAFLVDPYEQDWPLRMAACIASAIPMFLLYLCTQKIMLKGLDVSSSVKG